MTVKELNQKLKGYQKEEVNILFRLFDSYGNSHDIRCEFGEIISDEQGGNFFSSIILNGEYDDYSRLTIEDNREIDVYNP